MKIDGQKQTGLIGAAQCIGRTSPGGLEITPPLRYM